MTSYRKTMREAREEMVQSIHEANVIDKVKDIVKRKQATKIDGVLVDLFTASAISQIYDKVNPMNKKKMERLPIKKLASAAMRVMDKNEYIPEDMTVTASTDGGISQRDLDYVQKQLRKLGIRDAVVDQNEMDSNKIDVKTRMSDDKVKRAFDKSKIAVNYEHVELDEAKYDLYHKDFSSAMQHAYAMAKKLYGITIDPKEIDDKVATGPRKPGTGKTNMYRLKGDKGVIQVQVYNRGGDRKLKYPSRDFELNMYKEEVELGEEKGPRQLVNPNKEVMIVKKNKVIVIDKKDQDKYMKRGWSLAEEVELGEAAGDVEDLIKMVDELENASKMHLGQSKRIKAHLQGMKNDDYAGQEIKTEGAAADARRAMRSDPDMKQRFSKDMSATDADRAAASKNIIMQMRKSQSLRGRFDVEFKDGKKVKVPLKVALAVQQKYNSFRRPAEKEKFQNAVAKSYKDMLKALKEGFASDAQRRAAFAQGYKAKGKKGKKEDIDEAGYVKGKDPMPAGKELAKLMKKRRKGKKESKLERMNNKLQENKNG